jgi:hypothetical protein
MSNKINIMAAGGAGISVSDKVVRMVEELGTGFADIETYYMDTTSNNIDTIKHDPERFWLVKSKSASKSSISGSGGERSTHAPDIEANVKEFMDKHNLLNKVTGEYNVVIFSGSGGSGNVIATYYIKNLLERDLNVIAVLIGDSSNGLNAINTINTIASLDSVAQATNKPLSVMYVNNHAFAEKGMMQAEKMANNVIFQTLSALSLFLSGDNESLDYKDMEGIIDQSHYSTIETPPGLYGLCVFSKDVEIPKGSVPTVARTLTLEKISPDINITLLHHKTGYVTDVQAVEMYKEQFPLHLVTFANFFVSEEETLHELSDNYYNVMDSIKNKAVKGASRSRSNSSGGLVF